MLEKDINELLQDYKYRKNILEEITLSDIEKWNNIELDWENILNKPTTLEGYGITEELNSRYLNVEDGEVKNTSRLKWVGTFGEISSNYNGGMDYAKLSLMNGSLLLSAEVYDNENKRVLHYSDLDVGDGIKLFSHRGVILGNNTTLYTGNRSFNDDESNLFPIVQQDNGNLLFGSTKIPNKMNNTLKLPRVNILNSSDTYEGSLESDTYSIDGAVKDGLRLRHADGKYLMIGYTDNEKNTVYSYMICDVDGVLKNESDGDDWGPVRFEQNVFFRHGLRISSGEPLIINNYNVATKIANIEDAITTGTGMVKWANVLEKPSTFTPSSHSHSISDITSLQSSLDSKANSGFGIGEYISTLSTTLESAKKQSGVFYLQDFSPNSSEWIPVIQLSHSENFRALIAYDWIQNKLYTRSTYNNGDGGTWGDWNELILKKDIDNLHYDETIALFQPSTVTVNNNTVFMSELPSDRIQFDTYSILSVENGKVTVTIKENGRYDFESVTLLGSSETVLQIYHNNILLGTMANGSRNGDIKVGLAPCILQVGAKITFAFSGGSGVCGMLPIKVKRLH